MLLIERAERAVLPCIIEIDPYVALSFKTYADVLSSPMYYRIGNFTTSLLEIGIDRHSLLICKICLLGVGTVLPPELCPKAEIHEVVVGLPAVNPKCLAGELTDDPQGLAVCLKDRSLIIDWSDGKCLSHVIQYERMSFFLCETELRRIVVGQLDDCERSTLHMHMVGRDSGE